MCQFFGAFKKTLSVPYLSFCFYKHHLNLNLTNTFQAENLCVTQGCQNNGTCTFADEVKTCNCTANYVGDNCESKLFCTLSCLEGDRVLHVVVREPN